MIEIEIHGHIGFLTLNRPKAFNALSVEMIQVLYDTLHAWQNDNAVNAVVIRSITTDFFCAGGDVKALYQFKDAPTEELMHFFDCEFQLNYLLHVYPKPVITLLNGLVMGGGVGIGMHNRYTIAGENIVFAMPETAIGLFPDIGSSHLLNKLPEAWQNDVAVFGGRLGLDVLCAYSLVYAHIPTQDWQAFIDNLIKTQDVEKTIEIFRKPVSKVQVPCDEFWRLEAKTFAMLMDQVEHAQSPFFSNIQKNIPNLSPFSMYVSFEKQKLSHGMDLAQCLKLDFQLLYHFMKDSDFFEGVRAVMVDKDKHPHWKYQRWEDVPYSVVQSFFYGF